MSIDALTAAFASHPRHFDRFRWVYPVLSRRSGGLSLGVNLNPDRLCNFDCPYCQVDRRGPAPSGEVLPEGVESEVREMLGRVAATGLSEVFPGVEPERRKLSDIALSGDGEPTLRSEFAEVCRRLAQVRSGWIQAGGSPFKLVVITNATRLDQPAVREGLASLVSGGGGEVWGKLDAGTPDFYQAVNVSRVPLERVVQNLVGCAREFPLRIQTLFFENNGQVPSEAEIEVWLGHVERIHATGPLVGVQLHTVARQTAAPGCHPLPLDWLQSVAERVSRRTGLAAEVHGGVDSGSFASA
jgi:pyruvate-formate lyase-activating enzyme